MKQYMMIDRQKKRDRKKLQNLRFVLTENRWRKFADEKPQSCSIYFSFDDYYDRMQKKKKKSASIKSKI